MGHDITPLSRHNLNIKNIESLAKDLTDRLDLNIEFSYLGNKELGKLLGKNIPDEEIVLGKIIKDKSFKTYRLHDEDFLTKALIKKYGESIIDDPKYWIAKDYKPDAECIKDEKLKLSFPVYEFEKFRETPDDDYEYMCIYKEIFSNNFPYFLRWFQFCDIFIQGYLKNKDWLTSLMDYRKTLMYYTFKLGGDKIYFLDDQSNVLEGVGQGGEERMTWNELEEFVYRKTGHLMIDIPQFLTDKAYKNYFLSTNNIEFPLSFVDDFSDLL